MKKLHAGLFAVLLSCMVLEAATIYEGPDCRGICCVEKFIPTMPGGSYQLVNACRLTERVCYWFCSYTCPNGQATLKCGHSHDNILVCQVNKRALDLTHLECETPETIEPVTCGAKAAAQGFTDPCNKMACDYDIMSELCSLFGGEE